MQGQISLSLNHDFVGGHGKPGLAGKLLMHCFDDVVRHEGLAVVLANVPVGTKLVSLRR